MEEKPIGKPWAILLFLNTTCYKLAKDIPKMTEPINDNYYKHAYGFALAIEYVIADLVLRKYLRLNIGVLIVLLGILVLTQLIMSYVYDKKIETIVNNYYTYYNGYVYALFIILWIASFAYIFNSLIGVDMGPYHRYRFKVIEHINLNALKYLAGMIIAPKWPPFYLKANSRLYLLTAKKR